MLIVILLQACNMWAPEKEMVNLFEQVAKYESNINQHQKELVRLERKQVALYNDMMELGMKQAVQVTKLAKKAETIIEQREQQLEAEYRNMKKATRQMQKANEYVPQLHDPTLKQRLLRLIHVTEKRYASYEKLYVHYHTALAAEKELYRLLEQQNVTLAALQAQVEHINNAYQKMFDANEQFNEYTKQYNQEKKRLHDELQ